MGLYGCEACPISCCPPVIGEFISSSCNSDSVWIRLFWSVGNSETGVCDWLVGRYLVCVYESESTLPLGIIVALTDSSKFLFPTTGPQFPDFWVRVVD